MNLVGDFCNAVGQRIQSLPHIILHEVPDAVVHGVPHIVTHECPHFVTHELPKFVEGSVNFLVNNLLTRNNNIAELEVEVADLGNRLRAIRDLQARDEALLERMYGVMARSTPAAIEE